MAHQMEGSFSLLEVNGPPRNRALMRYRARHDQPDGAFGLRHHDPGPGGMHRRAFTFGEQRPEPVERGHEQCGAVDDPVRATNGRPGNMVRPRAGRGRPCRS